MTAKARPDIRTNDLVGPTSADVAATKTYVAALRMMSRPDPDVSHVLQLLLRSARRGNAEAIYALATWRLYGKKGLVKRDRAEGMRLLEIAAAGKSLNAMYDLAVSLEIGRRVPQNLAQAFRWYLKAALYGEKQSIYEVARCIYWGIGTDRNTDIAELWYERARDLGIT